MLCHENFKWRYEHLTPMWNQQNHTVASWFTCVSLFWEQWESCMNWDVSVYTCSSTPTLCLGSLMTQAGLWGQGAGGCSVSSFPSMSPFPASLLVNKDVPSVGKDVMGFLGYLRFFECLCLHPVHRASSGLDVLWPPPASEWPTHQSGTPHPSLCWRVSPYAVPTWVSLGALCSQGIREADWSRGQGRDTPAGCVQTLLCPTSLQPHVTALSR